MKLRRAVVTLPAAVAAMALLSACGSEAVVAGPGTTTTAPAMAHPTGADEVVLKLEVGGGLVPVEVAFGNVPALTIYGDGTVLEPGAVREIYPGPMVTPMFQRTISEEGLQAVLRAARDAGLLATPPSYESPASQQIADAATTSLLLQAGGGRWEHSAYALSEATPTTPAREALAGFVTKLGNLDQLAGAGTLSAPQPFEPKAYRIHATPNPTPPQDLKPTVLAWPEPSVDLSTASTCAIAAGAALPVIAQANQLTWFTQDGVTYSLAARPLLPGETGC